MAKERFSKATVQAAIQTWVDSIQSRRQFDPSNGSAQLRGASVDVHRDYGEWDTLCALADKLELPVYKSGTPANGAGS